VSNLGNIYSLINNQPKVAFLDAKGYMRVQLYKVGGIKITRKVHRLVAQHFIDNPMSKPQVNHLDGDKVNNKADNLEWCTQRENMKHAADSGVFDRRSDLHDIAPKLNRAIFMGYLINDMANAYDTTPGTITKIADKAGYSSNLDGLKLGRRNERVYYDKSRNKWRTELRKLGIKSRQFDTKNEAVAYVENKLKEKIEETI